MAAQPNGPRHSTILLSHLHWDHVAGLPFFTPIYVPGHRVEIASGPNGVMSHDDAIRSLFRRRSSRSSSTISAVPGDHARAARERSLRDRRHHGDDGARSTIPIRSTAIASSTPASRSCTRPTPSTSRASIRRSRSSRPGADILIYDAQYTPEEYPSQGRLGPLDVAAGAELARAAGGAAARAVPPRSGPQRRRSSRRSRRRRAPTLPGTVAAREGMVLSARDAEKAAAA